MEEALTQAISHFMKVVTARAKENRMFQGSLILKSWFFRVSCDEVFAIEESRNQAEKRFNPKGLSAAEPQPQGS
ncbi:MAG: hypothetical protein ACREP3_11075 [Candidatus Binatia bacterium]